MLSGQILTDEEYIPIRGDDPTYIAPRPAPRWKRAAIDYRNGYSLLAVYGSLPPVDYEDEHYEIGE